MPIKMVQGDVQQTAAQAIMLGLNTAGRIDVSDMETVLRDQHPVFFSDYRRMARAGRFSTGDLWFFRDATPWLIGAMVRESAGGATRQRHVEGVILKLIRDWQREGLQSLAIAPLCPEPEWAAVRQLIADYLHRLPIPIFIYERYIPGQVADEQINQPEDDAQD